MYPWGTVEYALLLSSLDVTDRENAQICGVSIRTIRHWRYGTRRDGTRGAPSCPRCDGKALDEEAYAYLLGLYLGDGCISASGDPAKGVWALRIACADAWPGLIAECQAAMAAVRPGNKVGRRQQCQGCTMVISSSRHWPCLFPQHGPGRKHKRKIELEPWQRVIVTEFSGDFARGLFHSDGCRFLSRVRRPLADGDHW